MRRSLFLTFFLRMMLAFAPVGSVWCVFGARRMGAAVVIALLAGGVLLLAVTAFGLTRFVRRALIPLQALAEGVPERAPALEELNLPDYSAFDELAGSIAGASSRARQVLKTAAESRHELEALLDYLARHPGRVFSRDHLLDAVWGDARFVTPRSVDVYVRRIREKIEADAETPRYLKTMRGAGYRFEMPKPAQAAV